ncbi:MAG TPA: M48 family metalloprotease [Candidatus Obscuribacter sp.]|nr:M48 family metalloprotease [Candidatus Obscuribacter sp.]HMY54844.1 M48 family metalloprotease [Candidatus Obscuribacter sp.]HND07387.1 M48 family metalloprotease [Candidatus Obscuribacter sp.]HNG73054.1 M48 family metalloprotease [Candidatus Obscuribacter sp.]
MAILHSQNQFLEGFYKFCDKLSLTDEQFEQTSKKAEQELRENPSLYMTKVKLMAILGYAFIFIVVGTLILTMIWLIQTTIMHHLRVYGLKILLLLAVLLFVILKALWVKSTPPEGLPISRQEAPALFEMIDDLCEKLNTRVDKVLLNDELNASVIQISKLGFLDVYENYLNLGLPLMLSQNADQFKAVLAHELGHLSGNHSKSSEWIYNLRIRWSNLLKNMGQDLFFMLFYTFFSWLAPRFNAYTLAMARAHELEADREAVAIAGAHPFSESMMLLPVRGRYLYNQFWPGIYKEAADTDKPPADVFHRLQRELAGYSPPRHELEETLRKAIEEEGSGADTHPPLKTRILHGHFTPVVSLTEEGMLDQSNLEIMEKPISPEESAATAYLGSWLPTAMENLARDWNAKIEPYWQAKHAELSEAKKRLQELAEKESREALSVEDLKERAYLTYQLHEIEDCIPIYRQVLALQPQEPAASYNLGMWLLEKKDEEGIEHIRAAIRARYALLPDAYPLWHSYLTEQGRVAEAEKLKQELDIYYKCADLARKERNNLNNDSPIQAYELEQSHLEYLQEVFRALPAVHEVYLVQRILVHMPEYPYLVLGIEMPSGAFSGTDDSDKVEMARALLDNLQMPAEFCVTVFDLGTIKLKNRMKAIEGSLIYRKAAK